MSNIPARPTNVRATSKNLSAPETASDIVAGTAQQTTTVTDSRGRAITVHRLNALAFYRLSKAMGPTASNAAAMDLATLASSVTEIDGDSVAPPSTERELEFLMQRLDFDGLAAVGEGLKQLSAGKDDGDVAKN
jgi:hypothetical protein